MNPKERMENQTLARLTPKVIQRGFKICSWCDCAVNRITGNKFHAFHPLTSMVRDFVPPSGMCKECHDSETENTKTRIKKLGTSAIPRLSRLCEYDAASGF